MAAKVPGVTFSNVTHKEGSRKDGHKRALFPCILSFAEIGKSFPKPPVFLFHLNSLNWILWPSSYRGGWENKYLEFSVSVVGSW